MKYSLTLFFVFLLTAVAAAQIGPLEIWQIQGAGRSSPYEGQEVLTAAGVVTAVGSDFMFVQTPDDRADEQDLTSNGIYIAGSQASARRVGELVQVRGIVREENRRTQIGPGNVQIASLGSADKLPEPVVLSADFPSGAAVELPELEAVEGMRVYFKGITAGPADFESVVPVVARTDRPFREPGIAYPGLAGLPVWDGNPEIFRLVPAALGQANNRFIAALTPVEASGLMDQQDGAYLLLPQSYTLGEAPKPRAVRTQREDEVTVGSLNLRVFVESEDNFSRRARKIARYITELLRGPDILAVQEAGSESALSTLSFYIRQLDPDLNYVPYFLAGNADIHTAFLLRAEKFTDIDIRQLGKQELLPGGGLLFDRPPLLLQASFNGGSQPPVSVLNLHLRSLLGIEGDNQSFVREKRYRQALAVGAMIQQLRDQNLLVVGDFNAYPFSDGYVDVLSIISGTASLGAQYPGDSPVDPPLDALVGSLPITEQYSYVFSGSAQLLDHALAAPLSGWKAPEVVFARANADYPDAFAPNEQLLERSSDHDGFVVYLQLEAPNAIGQSPPALPIKVYPNPVVAGRPLQVELPADQFLQLEVFSPDGKMMWAGSKQKGQRIVRLAAFPAGTYFLHVRHEQHRQSQKIIVLPGK